MIFQVIVWMTLIGLNFAIPTKKIEYLKFLLPFEFLVRNIKSNRESSVDLASIKAHLQDTAFTSYSTFNKENSPPFNLSNNKFEPLHKLKNENNEKPRKITKMIFVIYKFGYQRIIFYI